MPELSLRGSEAVTMWLKRARPAATERALLDDVDHLSQHIDV
jgi:hypothetical protein